MGEQLLANDHYPHIETIFLVSMQGDQMPLRFMYLTRKSRILEIYSVFQKEKSTETDWWLNTCHDG